MIMKADEILKVKKNVETNEISKAIHNTKTVLMEKISNKLLQLAQLGKELSITYKIKEKTCGNLKFLHFYEEDYYCGNTYYKKDTEKYDFNTLKKCLEENSLSFLITDDILKTKDSMLTCKNLTIYIEEN